MAWVRLDDEFGEHPKIARISDSALALFVTGLAYCNRNLTDGFIPSMVGMGQLRWCDGNATPHIRELEAVGLWETADGGWKVHDYLTYQWSREKVLYERKASQTRMQNLRASRSEDVRANFGRGSAAPNPIPKKRSKREPKGSLSSDIQKIYDHWREARGRTRVNYERISDGRKTKIQARLREFTVEDLCLAIDNVARDPWEERHRHDDLTVIFRNREQVERFLEMGTSVNGDHAKELAAIALRRRIAEKEGR